MQLTFHYLSFLEFLINFKPGTRKKILHRKSLATFKTLYVVCTWVSLTLTKQLINFVYFFLGKTKKNTILAS